MTRTRVVTITMYHIALAAHHSVDGEAWDVVQKLVDKRLPRNDDGHLHSVDHRQKDKGLVAEQGQIPSCVRAQRPEAAEHSGQNHATVSACQKRSGKVGGSEASEPHTPQNDVLIEAAESDGADAGGAFRNNRGNRQTLSADAVRSNRHGSPEDGRLDPNLTCVPERSATLRRRPGQCQPRATARWACRLVLA